MATGFGALGIPRFKKKICNGDFEKLGLKVKGGVALTLDLPLPVSVGIICIGGLLESEELIKTVFELCRLLLPVCRYGRLNFASKIFGGLNFDAVHEIHLHTYAV